MKTVAIVAFESKIKRSNDILSLTSLTPARGRYLHFHNPEKFKTKFYTWFVQVKKRYKLKNIKCSRFELNKKNEPLNGKGGRPLKELPPNYFSIWVE